MYEFGGELCMSEEEKVKVIENLLNESDVFISFLDDMLGNDKLNEKEKEMFLLDKMRLEKSRDELISFMKDSDKERSR